MRIRAKGQMLATLLAATVFLGLAITAGAQGLLVSEIKVEGAGYVSASVIENEIKGILSVGAELTPEKITAAREAIERLGYYDKVEVSQRVLAEGRVQVIISVVEKQRIEKILFVGNTVLSDDDLLGVINSKPGVLVDRRLAERDAVRVQSAYTKAGYFAQVAHANVDNFGVLTFVIEEARIEAIKITGLKRTKEWVVRRQIEIKPGELYQERKLISTVHRINELQLFKNVEFEAHLGELDPMNITVEFKVEETRTGQAGLALAYSSLDDLVLMVSVQENNFRGQAERASVSLEMFGRTSYDLSYEEPFWDEKGTAFEINLFDTERKRQFFGGAAVSTGSDEFEERRTGGSIRISRALDEANRRRATVRFRSEEVSSSFFQGVKYVGTQVPGGVSPAQTIDDLQDGDLRDIVDNPNLEPDIPGPGDILGPIKVAAPLHPGGRLASVTLGYSSDLRDSRLKTTMGSFWSGNAEFAGSFLGGEVSFTKLTGEYRYYRPVGKKKDVIAARIMAGASFGDLPLFESFTAGGSNTLRGYEEDRYRGENLLLGTVEYRRALNESLTLVGFVDVGDAYGGNFPTVVPGFSVPAEDQSFEPHVGIGVGARIVTPVGPFRIDIGWGEDGSQAHVNFGHTF
ncbi:MAG: BamA/TamA family outer membrane protein [Armatimonadetes bacterium]|nr:BamA/TamA family outer membrane protein [Armatimonadota bacterium]